MRPQSKLPLVFLYTDQRSAVKGATRFQKLVFLTQEETNLKEYYEYRPDRNGPFSPQLRSDLEILREQGYVDRNVKTNMYGHARIDYSLTPEGVREAKSLLNEANKSVFDLIQDIKRKYNDRPISDLLQYVYNKYEGYTTATDLNTEALFDPDALSEYEHAPKANVDIPSTIGEKLVATPHTLYQMPKRDTNAYFYYFTDDTYNSGDSKFKALDDELTLLGRNRGQLEVAIIDRDRIRPELWDSLIDGFEIERYPALVIAEEELGVRDLDLDPNEFIPSKADYAVIQNGIIADRILDDTDKIRDFLNSLFDCARRGDIKEGMRKKKILEGLSVTKNEITGILSITN